MPEALAVQPSVSGEQGALLRVGRGERRGRARAARRAADIRCGAGDELGDLCLPGSVWQDLPPLVWTLCLAAQMRPDRIGLDLVAWLLQCRVAQYLGAISYCLYMANEPIHKLLAAALSRVAEGDAAVFTAVWLPAALAAADPGVALVAPLCGNAGAAMGTQSPPGHGRSAHGDRVAGRWSHTRHTECIAALRICAGARPGAIGAVMKPPHTQPSRRLLSPSL